MKRLTSIILATFIILSCALSSVSCDSNEKSKDTTAADTASNSGFLLNSDEYVIIRPDNASDQITTATQTLKNAIKSATGYTPSLKTDWDNGEDNSTRREILVGATNRDLSQTMLSQLAENEYAINTEGNYIVIIGKTDELTLKAVDKFITDHLGETGDNIILTSANNAKITFEEKPNIRSDDKNYEYISNVYSTNSDDLDDEFIYENSAGVNDIVRFADGNGTLVYKFDISKMTEPTFSLYISQNYLIEVSTDDKNYITAADYTKVSSTPVRDMSNTTIININPYDYNIYTTLFIRISDTDTSDGWGGAISQFTINYYIPLSEDGGNLFLKTEEDKQMAEKLSSVVEPSEVDSYQIADDKGLIYNPISREAEKTGTINKYDNAEKLTATLEVDGVSLEVSYPANVTAYDAVPITYTLNNPEKTQNVHIEANAFQSAEKEAAFDLNLPGTVDLEYEYLGYVTGIYNTSNRPQLHSDFNDKISTAYPNYQTSELTASGEVAPADITWFKFKYTNVGNTVLEGDGNGTFCFEPVLYIKKGKQYEVFTIPENIYYRIIDDLYPGESGELWITFSPYPGYNMHSTALEAGDYKIVIKGIVRNETTNPENFGKNIWGGETYCSSEFYFTVKNNPAVTTIESKKSNPIRPTRNKWLHTYEEFMSSYDTWLKMTETTASSTMYLQCAPWTDSLTLRLIIGNTTNTIYKSLPLNVESDSLSVKFNPDNVNYVILEDGTRFPAITAQSMVDMRANVQLGPDAAANVIGTLVDMQKAGINLVTTTAAFEFDGSEGSSVNNNIDAYWFSVDVMRELNLTMEGFVSYPFESTGNIDKAAWINKDRISKLQAEGVSADKLLAIANGIKAVYQYKRWGDKYWLGANDTIVLSVEDTRGWMRIDFNARAKLSDSAKNKFRIFLKELYLNIDTLNKAWGSNYTSFDEIDPEEGTTDDHGYAAYKNGKAPFEEWNRATADLDTFRTYLRVHDYLLVAETAEEEMPDTKFNMRTEGGNWLVNIDPNTTNSHYRHVYYSQRRNAMIPDILSASGTLYSHSDYITVPYTPSEVAELTASAVSLGVIPMHLPQFNRMRDIASNKRWGNDFAYEYNTTGSTKKGAYINTVCSVYEWFKATYENGGVPGILWQDYLCDGCATSTQRKEIAFFTEKLRQALDTEEGRKWATDFTDNTSSILSTTLAKNSYDSTYVSELVNNYLDGNK